MFYPDFRSRAFTRGSFFVPEQGSILRLFSPTHTVTHQQAPRPGMARTVSDPIFYRFYGAETEQILWCGEYFREERFMI